MGDAGRATVEALVVHADERGGVYEPLDARELAAQRNAHVVWTAPGAVRGNHHHRLATEILTVAGPARVRLRDADGLRDLHVPEGAAYRFRIPPGVGHAIQNTGDATQCLVAFSDRAHDAEAPDVVRESLIEPDSPDR